MALADLIRKRSKGDVATAIPATPAIQRAGIDETVAIIATEAIVSTEGTTCQNGQKYRGWLLHFIDKESMECYFTPAANFDEVLESFPEAVAAVPILDKPK